MSLCIGHGLDAHRLVPGRALVLGCVAIPHDRGLDGHSDGDVVVHALGDALLGAAGQGDMGRHFPSSDERWRGAAGNEFLAAIARLLADAGARVLSAHVVAVAEEPRLGSHTEAMAAACAAALGIEARLVHVSATSTDGLGFAGRGEGISASAVVLLDRRD